jgi:hypothetical protein
MSRVVAYEPSISADGRLMTFWSRATNLTADDRDGGVFMRELFPAG